MAPFMNQADEAEELALRALGWILSDDERARRLLAVTGLTPDGLRARIGDRILLAGALSFLEAHEPDLIACADGIGTAPAMLASARGRLEA